VPLEEAISDPVTMSLFALGGVCILAGVKR